MLKVIRVRLHTYSSCKCIIVIYIYIVVLVARNTSKRQTASVSVAFTAIKVDAQRSIGLNQNIMFEKVLINIGGGYHVHHGVFQVPISGLYVISATLQNI